MLNESYIIIFCRTTYFDMLSMQHSSKQEPSKIYFFKNFWWFSRGIHDKLISAFWPKGRMRQKLACHLDPSGFSLRLHVLEGLSLSLRLEGLALALDLVYCPDMHDWAPILV